MQHKLINLFWSAYLSDFIVTWLNFLSLGHKWATRWGINEPLIFLHSEAFMLCICFHIDLVVRTYRIKSYCINLKRIIRTFVKIELHFVKLACVYMRCSLHIQNERRLNYVCIYFHGMYIWLIYAPSVVHFYPTDRFWKPFLIN